MWIINFSTALPRSVSQMATVHWPVWIPRTGALCFIVGWLLFCFYFDFAAVVGFLVDILFLFLFCRGFIYISFFISQSHKTFLLFLTNQGTKLLPRLKNFSHYQKKSIIFFLTSFSFEGHRLMAMVVMGQQLDWIISVDFSNVNDSIILQII